MMLVIPKWYTDREGGYWRLWPHSIGMDLHLLNKLPSPSTTILVQQDGRLLPIHSLLFEDLPGMTCRDYWRWDIINGWTD